MTNRLKSLMIAHGALVFLVGMLAGFPFAWVTVAAIDPSQAAGVAGDIRGWRMAHMEGVLNGVLLIAVAACLPRLKLGLPAQKTIAYGLIVTAWGNMIASVISPLTGGRGLAFTGLDWNSLTFTLFVIAIVTVVISMALVFLGAWRGRAMD